MSQGSLIADGAMLRDAEVSQDGKYRYWLGRSWGPGPLAEWNMLPREPWALFVMLNPSDGDAESDDPTIRKCEGFTRAWGMKSFEIVNLFGFRTPSPYTMARCYDPVGPGNSACILTAIEDEPTLVVAAWGASQPALTEPRAKWFDEVTQRLRTSTPFKCLGRTKSGSPRHPLMLPYSTPLEPWPVAP